MKYKIMLYPDTFFWAKGDDVLFYNASSFGWFEHRLTPEVRFLCEQWSDYDNLYSATIEYDRTPEKVKYFIRLVTKHKIGVLLENGANYISLPPLLNIQENAERIKQNPSAFTNTHILQYLTEVTIYVGGSSVKTNEYYRQTIYPVHSKEKLSIRDIRGFIESVQTPYLQTINIVLTDLSDSEYLSGLLVALAQYKEVVCIYMAGNVSTGKYNIIDDLLSAGFKNIVLTGFPDDDYIHAISHFRQRSGVSYNLLVTTAAEYELWAEAVKINSVTGFKFILLYDNNIDFFNENVCLNKEDILSANLSKREIFMHQSLNTNFFGKLTLMPDKNVYSNENKPSIGKIGDSVYDLIKSELENNYSWRLLRNTEPCRDCLYQFLCPSPSNYEFVIGRPNLCTVK